MDYSICKDINNFDIKENGINEMFNKFITLSNNENNKDKFINNKQISEEEILNFNFTCDSIYKDFLKLI